MTSKSGIVLCGKLKYCENFFGERVGKDTSRDKEYTSCSRYRSFRLSNIERWEDEKPSFHVTPASSIGEKKQSLSIAAVRDS